MKDPSESQVLYLSALLEYEYNFFFREFVDLLDELSIEWRMLEKTNEIWCRDFMPVQVAKNKFVQFIFNPDYLDGYEFLVTDPHAVCEMISLKPIYSGLIIDGGNIVRSQTKVICTDKIYSENRKFSELEIRAELRRLLEVDEIISIPKEPYDIIGHSDGMIRFIDGDTVLLNSYSECMPSFQLELLARLFEFSGLKIESMPYRIFNTVNSDNIPSAKGNYINFLQIGKVIILPQYNIEEDDMD